jgi:hypothetical protein
VLELDGRRISRLSVGRPPQPEDGDDAGLPDAEVTPGR